MRHHDVGAKKNNRFLSAVHSNQSSSTKHEHANSKVVSSAKEALEGCIFPGMSISVGGFGLGGTPETLLNELSTSKELEHLAKDLTVASLTAGVDNFALGKLFEAKKVKRMIVRAECKLQSILRSFIYCSWSRLSNTY